MNPHYWQSQIEDIADRASKESGTSYDEYIRLFTLKHLSDGQVWLFALRVTSDTLQNPGEEGKH
ncbi:hypothetical protein [Vibrio parahaemolyticus]|uniref:hypothetical protein n=1 Tax=Vibrio parahaemolyticus TaxID=670 RepID=UPI002151B90D|nr:hypothetical protein [Vibrio parahaemolyticus]